MKKNQEKQRVALTAKQSGVVSVFAQRVFDENQPFIARTHGRLRHAQPQDCAVRATRLDTGGAGG